MMIFFLILFYFRLFIPLISNAQLIHSNQEKQTCLLPYVTKPCINNGKDLSCTFSLNSSERNKTCDLSSVPLFFTTTHIELFLISKYYDQIILADYHTITKLILQLNATNRRYEYSHWFYVRILSIEMPVDSNEFMIIHEIRSLLVTHHVDKFNKQYWHLLVMPTKCGQCERTVFNTISNKTQPYLCPYNNRRSKGRMCGVEYACLNNNPCYFTGYRELVCQIDKLDWSMNFQTHDNTSQYETIFIDVLDHNSETEHTIQKNTFVAKNNYDNTIFVTKKLILIISVGILHISARFFDSVHDFQVRIEHSSCADGKFVMDIVDDTASFDNFEMIEYTASLKNVDIIDYTSAKTGGSECLLNKNQ
jgi:hypothetical protein